MKKETGEDEMQGWEERGERFVESQRVGSRESERAGEREGG